MANSNDGPPPDSNLSGFKAILAKKKAAQAAKQAPANLGSKAKAQKPRPKDRIRRRP